LQFRISLTGRSSLHLFLRKSTNQKPTPENRQGAPGKEKAAFETDFEMITRQKQIKEHP
jgi:hypothetical protein